MFGNTKLLERVNALMKKLDEPKTHVDNLKAKISSLKDELENLKLDATIERRDIEHLVKVKEEKSALANERKVIELEREKEKEVREIREEYARKLQDYLEQRGDDMKDMYTQVLDRLPNINVKGKI